MKYLLANRPLAVDGQARFVGSGEPLPKLFEFQVPGDLHVDAEALLGLELVKEVFGFLDGGVEIASLERLENIPGDVRDFETSLEVGLLRARPRIDQDRAILQPLSALVRALVHRTNLVFVYDLCISRTGGCVRSPALSTICT